MKLITFDFQCTLQYPLLFSFIFYIKHIFTVPLTMIKNGSTYSVLFYSIGLLFAFIPLYKSRTIKRRAESIYTNMTKAAQGLSFPRLQQKEDRQGKLYYTLLAFVCISSIMIQFIQTDLINSEMWLNAHSCLSMLGTYIAVGLCYVIFKTSMFRHKILSLSLLVIVSAILGFFFYSSLSTVETSKYGPIILYVVLLMVLNPLREVVEKYLMEYYLINRFNIMLYEGIMGCGVSGLMLIINLFSDFTMNLFDKEQKAFNEGIKWKEGIAIVCLVGVSFLLCHLRLASNEYFHPVQRYSFDCLPYFLMSIGFAICCFLKHQNYYPEEIKEIFLFFGRKIYGEVENYKIILVTLALDILLSFIWLFSAALLNEIIILKCCHLDDFTIKKIGDRAEKEVKDHQIDIIQINKTEEESLI